MVTVEIENRSGAEVDEQGAEELARAVLAAEGIDDGDLGLRSSARTRCATLKREHLGGDEATDVLSFPIDGRDDLPDGVPRQLGDAVLCPQVVGEAWRAPLVHGLLHLLGYDHGVEMERREAELASWPPRPAGAPSLLESFNFAFEGVIHVLRTQRNMRIHFAIAAAVLIAAVAVGVGADRADRAAARDLVRPDRGDDQLGARSGDRRRDDLLRPSREARQGHRRGRRPDRDGERRRRRLPRLLRMPSRTGARG